MDWKKKKKKKPSTLELNHKIGLSNARANPHDFGFGDGFRYLIYTKAQQQNKIDKLDLIKI